MANETKTITIVAKAKSNKSFKAGDDWYNVLDNVIPYLEKVNKGDEITITFYKKGTANYVTTLFKGKGNKEETTEEMTTGFKCEVCGKELRDGKYKKCYDCNKNKSVKKEETTGTASETKISTFYKSNYGSPEDVAGKELGCALGAAASAAAGQSFDSPDTAAQWIKIVADLLVEWIRAKK